MKLLIENIKTNFKQIRIVGICFGHQLLSHCLGGKVEMIENVSVKSGYIRHMDLMRLRIKIEEEQFREMFQLEDSVMRRIKKEGLFLAKSHEQQVVMKSELQTHVADSQTTLHELLVVDDFAVSLQGHPEMTGPYYVYKLLA